MKRLLFCLAWFGCGDDNAVGVEIRVPDSLFSVDTVELVLGVGPCLGDCTGVAPPADEGSANLVAIPGEVYAVDDEKVFVSSVSDGRAVFSIEAEATILPAVIAVGNGGGQLGTVILDAIDLGSKRNYVAELVPAGAKLVDTSEPNATNVEQWSSGLAKCIGAEVADTGRRVFIVSEFDPDCDEVAQADECDPFVHLSTEAAVPVDVDALACTTTAIVDDNPEKSCLLGAPICEERNGIGFGCKNANEVCVSDHVCECAAFDAACLETVYATDPADAPTVIRCAMEVVDNGGPNLAPCFPQSLIGPSFGQPVGGVCSGALTMAPVAVPLGAFGISHAIALPAAHQLALTVHDPTGAECRLQVDWAGSFDKASGVQKLATLVKLDVSATRSVIVPLVIDPVIVQGTNNCTGIAGNRCDLIEAPSDTVSACIR